MYFLFAVLLLYGIARNNQSILYCGVATQTGMPELKLSHDMVYENVDTESID
jgi:hypothetical protein